MSPVRKVTVYDPTADPKSTGVTLAPRLDTFKGKRAGILDNGKPNAGFLMLAVAERLRASYGVTEIVKREKPVAVHVRACALPARAARGRIPAAAGE